MRFQIVSVGRERSDPAAPLVADYVGRIKKFFPIENRVLPPDRNDRISEKMLKEAKKGDLLVALDERGKEYNSAAFADLVESWMNRGVSRIVFVIGGADGLPDSIVERANLRVALSRMTFPHRLARLFLVEQLYRALCTIRRIPYQK
ncbi:MAG: 23S rRNA (pseudouridine(1915)-N(3))-methyltransferase RlmH [Deltaproteobacteria bacterium]|nr:23S rRNA (pseudouridine(1915)-N(3))-methyltransferase RlmH [Deltaproteobacteria bacterium]